MIRSLRYYLVLIQRTTLRFPKITLALFYALGLAGLLAAGHLEQLIDLNDIFDKDFATYDQLQLLNESFPEKNITYVIISTHQAGTPPSKKALCALSRWVLDVSHQESDVLQVVSSFGARYGTQNGHLMGMEKILHVNCDDLENPETENIKSSLKAMHDTPWRAILASKNSDDIVISFHLDSSLEGKNPFRQEQLTTFRTQTIEELRESLQSQVLSQFPELQASWSGVGSFKYHLKKSYDLAGVTNNLGLVVILLFFRLLFGTWKSGFLFILSYLMALFPILGGMAAKLIPLDTLTTALPIMLLIAGLEDFIYVSFLRKSSGKNWRRPFRKIIFPGFWTSVSTFIGFGSLASSSLTIIERFGVWCALAVMMEFLTCFYFLPALLKVHPRLRQWVLVREDARLHRWIDWLSAKDLPRWAAWGSIALFAMIPFGLGRLHITERPEDSFPAHHEVHQVLKKMHESRGWQTELSLVFSDWSQKDKNISILQKISENPHVQTIESPYEVENFLVRKMDPAQGKILLDFWRETPMAQRLRNENGKLARALIYVKDAENNSIQSMQNQATALCQNDCYLGGIMVSYGEFSGRVLQTLVESLSWSDFFVALVLVLLCWAQQIRRVRTIFCVILSSLWGPLFIFWLFVVFQIPVFYVTSIFASVLVGLAGDNAVQYIFSKRKGHVLEGARELGPAAIYLCITAALVSVVFLLSPFAPVNKLGLLMISGLIATLIGDLWILKALLK